MTPEQEQMLSRLEAIELRKASANFGSKMWLKSDDDAQIEEDLPTLLSLVREQAMALEEARKALFISNGNIKNFSELTVKTLNRLQGPLKKHQAELRQIGRDFDNSQELSGEQIALLVNVLSAFWDELEGRERFESNE